MEIFPCFEDGCWREEHRSFQKGGTVENGDTVYCGFLFFDIFVSCDVMNLMQSAERSTFRWSCWFKFEKRRYICVEHR